MEVARPLWRTLCWAAENPPHAHASFAADVAALQAKVRLLRDSTTTLPERTCVGAELFDRVRASFEQIGRLDLFDHGTPPCDVPCIEEFSPAVAMFGGVEPALDGADVASMRDALVESCGGQDGRELASLVVERCDEPLGVPHQDGDRFATELLEDLDMLNADQAVDIRNICRRLDVRVDQTAFNTDSIRGIAFAGVGFAPGIVVNDTHPFNDNESGRRFTIAHELCHVLFDRTRARRVAHASGPWAPSGVEKRANAFAAYLLMPRGLVHSSIRANPIDDLEIRRLAGALEVNESALPVATGCGMLFGSRGTVRLLARRAGPHGHAGIRHHQPVGIGGVVPESFAVSSDRRRGTALCPVVRLHDAHRSSSTMTTRLASVALHVYSVPPLRVR